MEDQGHIGLGIHAITKISLAVWCLFILNVQVFKFFHDL